MTELILLSGTRGEKESGKAVQACNDYLRMGPGRSIAGLYRQYKADPDNAISTSNGTLYHWSKTYKWVDRAEEYDIALEEAKTSRASLVMDSGLALPWKRVEELVAHYERLKKELEEEGNLWVPDYKKIGTGKTAELVKVYRYNSALVRDVFQALEDLAHETGGRIRRQDITSGDERVDVVGIRIMGPGLEDPSEDD